MVMLTKPSLGYFFRFVYDNGLEQSVGLLGIVNDLSSKEELDWLVRCGVSRVSKQLYSRFKNLSDYQCSVPS